MVHFWRPLAHFWLPLAPFWFPPFGALWLPFGAPLFNFGDHWHHFGALSLAFGTLWVQISIVVVTFFNFPMFFRICTFIFHFWYKFQHFLSQFLNIHMFPSLSFHFLPLWRLCITKIHDYITVIDVGSREVAFFNYKKCCSRFVSLILHVVWHQRQNAFYTLGPRLAMTVPFWHLFGSMLILLVTLSEFS